MVPVTDSEELKHSGPNGGGPRDLDPDDRGGGGGGDDDRDPPGYVPGAGLLAMRFVLVSITALFITVGIAYFARSRSPVNWQHIRVPHLLWLSTALILTSSWTLETARARFERRANEQYVRWLATTLGAGLAFFGSPFVALPALV